MKETSSEACYPTWKYMDVSKNNGTPQIIHFKKGFPLFSPSIWGTPIFGNTHVTVCTMKWMVGRRFVSLKRWLPSALGLCFAPQTGVPSSPRDEQLIACRFLDFYPFKKNGCNLTCCAYFFSTKHGILVMNRNLPNHLLLNRGYWHGVGFFYVKKNRDF